MSMITCMPYDESLNPSYKGVSALQGIVTRNPNFRRSHSLSLGVTYVYTSQVHKTFHCGHTCVRIRGVHNGNVVLEMV